MGAPALPTRTEPDIRLFGTVDQTTLSEFHRQQSEAPADKPLVFELSTSGGDADTGRRIADELRLWQEQGREIFFLGKTYVFSAGITIMSAIPPDHRYLTAGTELLIHERKMDQEGSCAGRCALAVPPFTTCWRKSNPGSDWSGTASRNLLRARRSRWTTS